jgi:hypothetical protein
MEREREREREREVVAGAYEIHYVYYIKTIGKF